MPGTTEGTNSMSYRMICCFKNEKNKKDARLSLVPIPGVLMTSVSGAMIPES